MMDNGGRRVKEMEAPEKASPDLGRRIPNDVP
jgi:hypothetical protein